jgi:peptide methionine sulfoxide reductase msrA/msrB
MRQQMNKLLLVIIIFILISGYHIFSNPGESRQMNTKFNTLTPAEQSVILHKGTEPPFSGKLLKNNKKGTYICRQCDAPLYRSESKFDSGCGWPAFDDEIPQAVKRIPDSDGIRTEILCANCNAHLGHVFTGERLTDKNIRHCVNSISLSFIEDNPDQPKHKKAFFAGGCFWGVEHLMASIDGVISVDSGYTGGNLEDPSYEQVCSGTTGHYEAVEVIYDPEKVNFTDLLKAFFEIHDFTQTNGQGPDIGPQYRSAVFFTDEEQKKQTVQLIESLKNKAYKVVTAVLPFTKFYKAESYHQDYYKKTGKMPYCHTRKKIFD